MSALPPEWAINKALAAVVPSIDSYNLKSWTIEAITQGAELKLAYCLLTLDFARYIAEHEEEPVDPLYEALFAVVSMGRYDTREQTQLLRGELAKRGLSIVKAGGAA